jgi:hypothetical protein
MSPSLRRYLPFMIGAFVLLILLPTLFKKGSSTTSSAATQSTETVAALNLVDSSEERYQAAHGRYTSHLADLLLESRGLAHDLTEGLGIQLDTSTDGQSYYALVESPVLSLLRARHDRTIVAQNCVIVKSESGVSCPAAAHKSG